MTEISLIICTRNRANSLSKTLDSVADSVNFAPSIAIEIVLVDNGSTDRTVAVIEEWKQAVSFPVVSVYEKRPGLSVARNSGILAARGNIIAFTDDDCTLYPDYFIHLHNHYQRISAPALIGGKVELGDPTDQPYTILTDNNAKRLDDVTLPAGFIIGANMTFSREIVNKIGFFDERFGSGAMFKASEDTDYVYRAYKAGFPVEYVPDVAVRHFHGRKDKTSIIELSFGYEMGRGALYAKHFSDYKLLKHFYWDFRKCLFEVFGGNHFNDSIGLTYRSVIVANIIGMFTYPIFTLKNYLAKRFGALHAEKTATKNKNLLDYTDDSGSTEILQSRIYEVVSPLVPEDGRFALVDFPDHPNVGDNAIWLGEINYFKTMHGVLPGYVCTADFNFQELETYLPTGPIFIHGGGNFGDLWPWYQKYREALLQYFPNRKIIQLPQSIHFSDKEAIQRAASVINSHSDFTLLVRDEASLSFAKKFFTCTVRLCPDMAFYMQKPFVRQAQSRDLLLLLRTDKEQLTQIRKSSVHLPANTLNVDWPDHDGDLRHQVRRQATKLLFPQLGIRAFDKQKRRLFFYEKLAQTRFDKGIYLLSSTKFVITDRLHAHILCLLLNIPHIILDNIYGKLSGFSNVWTKCSPLVHSASSLSNAVNLYYNLHSKNIDESKKIERKS